MGGGRASDTVYTLYINYIHCTGIYSIHYLHYQKPPPTTSEAPIVPSRPYLPYSAIAESAAYGFCCGQTEEGGGGGGGGGLGSISRSQQKRDLDAEFGGRAKQAAHKKFCLCSPTPRLRGWACAMAERVCAEALTSRTSTAWGHFFNAAHKAMDMPKQYTAECLAAVQEVLTE